MELKPALKREQYASVTKSSIWKHKNASDAARIKKKLQKQLSTDILCLFETSQFVDLKLESSEGFIYSHRVIVAGRFPSCWSLLAEIGQIQIKKYNREQNPLDILIVSLPKVNFSELKAFIRSLYTNEVDEVAGITLKIYLEKQLITLKQSLFENQKLYLEKLNFEEELRLQSLLLSQLRRGEISEERGNLRDVTHLVPNKLRCGPKYPIKTHSAHHFDRTLRTVEFDDCRDAGYYSNFRLTSRIPVRGKDNFDLMSRPSACTYPVENCNKLEMSSKSLNENFESSDENNSNVISEQIVESRKSVSQLLENYSQNKSPKDEGRVRYANSSQPEKCLPSNPNGLDKGQSQSGSGVKAKVRKMEGLITSRKLSSESLLSYSSTKQPRLCSIDKSSFDSDDGKSHFFRSIQDEEIPTSDSDANGLHETSSLEVELPTSHEDHSLSPDSAKSEGSSNDDNMNTDDDSKKKIDPDSEDTAKNEISNHKPLVRTRTFDLIEPTCSTLHYESNDNVETEDDNPSNETLEIENHTESNVVHFAAEFTDQQLKTKTENKLTEEDPDKLREIERKKGSLLFEHNIQTFSNIPTTNLMNLSMSSDTSLGLASLYNSMMESGMLGSITSVCGNESTLQDSSFLGSSLDYSTTLTNIQLGSSEKPFGKNVGSTRSPSPDSLCVDAAPFNGSKKSNSVSKEDLNFEEKERDEKEELTHSICSSPPEDEGFVLQSEEFPIMNLSNSESPKIKRKEDNKPIVSIVPTFSKDDVQNMEDRHPKSTQRQFSSSSVKDVDAIPLVCGFVSSEGKEEEDTLNSGPVDDDGQQPQSMFSMFINFNEIPSPQKEENVPPVNNKPQPTGGMYMFIEADKVSSPKTKRRNKLESDVSKFHKLPTKLDSEPTSIPETLLHNSPVPMKYKGMRSETHKSITASKGENKASNDDTREKKDDDKKGFFVFIEADNSSKRNSPKVKRRPHVLRKPSKQESSVMSKSAPSDCLLFNVEDSSKSSTTESSNKLMTKSVIDREEFMAQPPTRRNVSLNDKINESSKIPRPISNFKEKISLETCKKEPVSQKTPQKDKIVNKKKGRPSDINGVKSMEGSMSEAATSLSVSFSEVASSLPADAEDGSEFSDVSSLLSSIDRSNEPSDQDGKGSSNSLGDDLLKMLINEINTDVVIQIGEKKIRAHKCILASRCVYFAAMLSGHWVESAGNIIKLQGFSAEAVMVALKHIYSGSSTVPEDVKVGELAALADMLALDGLKDVVAHHLKANSCHYFHKPCSECVNGVLEVLPIAGAFCLEELYHKCLKWIAKNFVTVIPTRSFASLPSELQDRCLKQINDDMSVSNVIDTALGGERVLSVLSVVRWTQPIFDFTARLLESVTNFMATNLCGVLSSDRFVELGKDGGWNGDSLEDTLKMACELVRPDQAVLSHIELSKLADTRQEDGINEFSEVFLNMVDRLLKQIEKFIIHNANRVAVCRKWPLLSPETQKRIKDAAMVVVEFSKPLTPKPKFSSATRVRSRGASIEPVQRLRTSSMSDHRLSRSASANVVPSKASHSAGSSAKRIQPPSGRCHTPPPSALRTSLQTPPPTRASTLRAQARQAAIQRSQSARTVVEKPKKSKPGMNLAPSDISTENESSSSRSKFLPLTRSRTSSQSSFHTYSGASRSSTPGIPERIKHRRNGSGPPQLTVNKPLQIDDDDDVFQTSGGSLIGSSGTGSSEVLKAQALDVQEKNPRCSSIGESPLHRSGNAPRSENQPRDGKRSFTPSRNRVKPSVGRRLRSPLRENQHHRIPQQQQHPATTHPVCKGTAPPPPAIDPRRQDGSRPIVVGLGSRSNTFCKDDCPNQAASSDVA